MCGGLVVIFSKQRIRESLRVSLLSVEVQDLTFFFFFTDDSLVFCNANYERLTNWKVKFLSQAGKEILSKVVIQAILTYSMIAFQLPKKLGRDINTMMQKFW